MTTHRMAGHAPRVAAMAEDLGRIGACIGCEDCRGLCAALIEALSLPGAVLGGQGRS